MEAIVQKTKLALGTLSKLPGNLGDLAFSFSRHLEAEGKATETIYNYLTAGFCLLSRGDLRKLLFNGNS